MSRLSIPCLRVAEDDGQQPLLDGVVEGPFELPEDGAGVVVFAEAGRAAGLAYEVWRRARGDKFVRLFAGQMLAKFGDPEKAVEVYVATERVEGGWVPYWQLATVLRGWGMHARAVLFLDRNGRRLRTFADAKQALEDIAKEVKEA